MRGAVLVLALLAVLAGRAAAEPATLINDLIEQALSLDRQVVTIEGEVYGDIMIRRTHGWVTITDNSGDLSIWAPVDLLRQVKNIGRYHTRGDLIRVRGEFRRADPAHGGVLTLHATALEVVQAGGPVEHPLRKDRLLLAGGALAAAAVTGGWIRQRRRQQGDRKKVVRSTP